jgi:hypothetical protein
MLYCIQRDEATSQRRKKLKRQDTATKIVHIIARYEVKSHAGLVLYRVRSSDGKGEYCTRLLNGKSQCCSCPSTKPCYHMKGLEQIEVARAAAQVVAEQEQEVQSERADYAVFVASAQQRRTAPLYAREFRLMR